MAEFDHQAQALKSARRSKGWSQSRLATTLEQAARALDQIKDLPPGGRQTLLQYISYFENGKRAVPERLKPIFREAFQATDEDLGLSSTLIPPVLTSFFRLPAAHLESSGAAVVAALRAILKTNVQADAQIGPSYLIPAVQGQLPISSKSAV